MRVSFDVRGLASAGSSLRSQYKQLRFATVSAINNLAFEARELEQREMLDVFDRPKPFTLKSVRVIKASREQEQIAARMEIDNMGTESDTPAAKYLRAQVSGGGHRRLKRFERALRSVGVLPPDMYAIPASGARLDAYGNISPGQIIQILSYFRAFPDVGFRSNMTDKGRARLAAKRSRKNAAAGISYFVGRPGGSRSNSYPEGVWQRTHFAHGSSLKPVLIFVKSVKYEDIFDFGYVAEQAARKRLPALFAEAVGKAMATAR